MPVSRRPVGRTESASHFNPDILLSEWSSSKNRLPQNNDLKASILETFRLPKDDEYVYHASASVTLSQVQQAIKHGGSYGLHAWYLDEEGKPLPPPPETDIDAYTAIFSPDRTASNAMKNFAANAKRGSHRAHVAEYLTSKRLLAPSLSVSKLPRDIVYVNIYFDFWAWSCRCLEWCGPGKGTSKIVQSHHILPIFYHHFGCVVPSYEALEVINKIARKRQIVEIGSGTGYWTFMLRTLGLEVTAVDNKQSEYRTTWIEDTIKVDGQSYLADTQGARDAMLLLVYPIVGSDFTTTILDIYQGDTICVAATQNENRFTAFNDRTIDEYVAERKKEYAKIGQIPLPSFAGKDDALFIFERM